MAGHTGPVGDEPAAKLRELFADHEVVELTLLVGATMMLNRSCTALALPTSAAATRAVAISADALFRRGRAGMSDIGEAVEAGLLPGRMWLYSNYHCNLACSYCLTESAPGVSRRELTADLMVDLARQAADLGFRALGVTGGEPFLMPHMPGTLARLGEILPTVGLTNGTLFTGRRLAAAGVLAGADVALQISLDSDDPDVNDDAPRAGQLLHTNRIHVA